VLDLTVNGEHSATALDFLLAADDERSWTTFAFPTQRALKDARITVEPSQPGLALLISLTIPVLRFTPSCNPTPKAHSINMPSSSEAMYKLYGDANMAPHERSPWHRRTMTLPTSFWTGIRSFRRAKSLYWTKSLTGSVAKSCQAILREMMSCWTSYEL
jgi:hypothetical protein